MRSLLYAQSSFVYILIESNPLYWPISSSSVEVFLKCLLLSWSEHIMKLKCLMQLIYGHVTFVSTHTHTHHNVQAYCLCTVYYMHQSTYELHHGVHASAYFPTGGYKHSICTHQKNIAKLKTWHWHESEEEKDFLLPSLWSLTFQILLAQILSEIRGETCIISEFKNYFVMKRPTCMSAVELIFESM